MKCKWCGTGADNLDKNCSHCGAPLSITVKYVVIDFSGVDESIKLSCAMTPFMNDNILPSRCFDIAFDDETATLTYRRPTSGGGGAVAQGPRAVAVGQRGVYIGGNFSGNMVTGDNNTVTNSKTAEPVVLSLWLPAGINYILISGNGESNCQCEVKYDGAQVVPQNATLR